MITKVLKNKTELEDEKINNITKDCVNEYKHKLIPAGTKGVNDSKKHKNFNNE